LCAVKHAILRAFHVYFQDVNAGYAVLGAKVVNRVSLNLNRLSCISFPTSTVTA
jgi:hypothetical protein